VQVFDDKRALLSDDFDDVDASSVGFEPTGSCTETYGGAKRPISTAHGSFRLSRRFGQQSAG
jgi:hypothetical protein